MASIFAFRTRSPDRDRQTDQTRFGHLSRTLEQLASEIEAERSGIRSRYEAVSANAAFLVEAMDNSEVSARGNAEMDQLTESLKSCLRRIEALGRQTEFVAEIRQLVVAFVDEGRKSGGETSSGQAPGEVARRV